MIFGGTSGIGFATAGRFIQECAIRTVIVGRNEKKGNLAVQVLKQEASQQHCADKGEVEYIKADITNRAQVRSVLESFHNTNGGRLQVVVQTAATVGYSGNFANLPDEILFTGRDAVYNNLYGTKTVTQEALRFWGKDKCTPLQFKACDDLGYVPSLTLLSSMNGMTPTALGESYGQSKHGIINIATSVGQSYPQELRVNAILPGLINTPFTWNQARNIELQPGGNYSVNYDMQTSWQCTVDGKFIQNGECPGGGTGYGCPCEDLFKDDARVEVLLEASGAPKMIDPRRVGDAILEIADERSNVTSASKVVDEQKIFQCVNETGFNVTMATWEPLWEFCPQVQMDAHDMAWAV